ncbi:hypothetical protein [Curtobacterium oceanosedimentum]|uniref:arsenate reductase/protein-tyrosine-phosphatase family protein n=1 Tax=Curtobacterium oceanosedimentum TaxID=465820 RepID=UPI003395DA46
MTDPFRVLFVCEGNVCRSPWAEVALRRCWPTAAAGQLVVSSAGTHAARGQAAHAFLTPLCADDAEREAIERHRARRVDGALLREQDLVLVAARAQRSDLLESWPAALHRTFTVGEVARLVRSEPIRAEERATPIHELLARRRRPIDPAADEDIDDPVRGTLDDFRRMAARTQQLLGEVAPALASVIGDAGRRVHA